VLALLPHMSLPSAWGDIVRRWADSLPPSVRVADGPLPPQQAYFIYCWERGSDFHQSAFSRDSQSAYRQHGEKPVTQGRFVLRPRWKLDYAAMVRAYVAMSLRDAAQDA